MSATRLADLGGALLVRPGRPRPHNLVSTRPDLTDLLTRGKPAAGLADILGSLYSLCGHAHRLCARRAVAAASGRADADERDAASALQLGSLREHLRRLCMDWPGQLAAASRRDALAAQAMSQLRQCPAFAVLSPQSGMSAGEALPGLLDWLQRTVLQMPASEWLLAWEHDPQAWLLEWAGRSEGWVAELFRGAPAVADRVLPAVDLQPHACAGSLRELADTLRESATFVRQPFWNGACADTGPWNRLNQPAGRRLDNPRLRLGARLAEVARLALPDEARRSGAQWLESGSLAVGPGEALAWAEMARGLLVHHVRLDNQDDAARVESCRVLAPTEWNFHPAGALAAALECLSSEVTPKLQRDVALLMAAYDPCVPYEIEPAWLEEVAHA
ncbi:hypothetical protein [Methylibium sp.]|uniref:hypothetical protein n=1 Tax=Methylibium sp. TaxID=2067992 RepID=UPI00333F6708